MTVPDTPKLVHSLDGRYYTDPAIFAKEQAGLLARTWQFAGHASQIRNPGDYFTFEIGGESLFCIRGRDGNLKTFYNVCQHRAHQLVQGTGTTRVVVCPYHAWSYELSGELRAGPNVNSVPGFDRKKICLTSVRTEDFHGFIFVNLDPDAASMEEWYPGVRAELGEYVPQIDKLAPLEWVEIPEHCNWKVSVENYSECYHCTLNHPTFATGVIKPETYDIQPMNTGYVLRHTTECQSMEAMSYPVDLSVQHAGEYRSFFLWPMFSFQVYPGNVLESLQMFAELCSRPSGSAAEIGFDAIADVPPGGHFFQTQHTMDRYQTAFYSPIVADLNNFGTWSEHGSLTSTERATNVWKRVLQEAQKPEGAEARVDAILPMIDAFTAQGGGETMD